jgi:hypothetical protein
MTRPASQVQVQVSEQLSPLLRSIQREITERTLILRSSEERLEAFRETRMIHTAEFARLQSEVSLQRRELRRIESELSRLGIRFDAEDPRPIVAVPIAFGTSHRKDFGLEDSGFRHRSAART